MSYVDPSAFTSPAAQELTRRMNEITQDMEVQRQRPYDEEAATILKSMGYTPRREQAEQQRPSLQEVALYPVQSYQPSSPVPARGTPDDALAAEARRILADWATYPQDQSPTI